MKFSPRRLALEAVRVIVSLGLGWFVAGCVGTPTVGSSPAAPTPISHAAIRIGADAVGTLTLYRNRGSQTVEAGVQAANQDVVGVLVIACTPAGRGPDQPAMCDSSADNPSGQVAMHQQGTAHAELTEPTGGCVVARAWVARGNRTAEATLTLPYGNRPAHARCP